MLLINSLITIFLIATPIYSAAETIYEWTDPWGHVQYSQTPVPGSRISEVTTLPKVKKTTEQQKQQAMSHKLKQINATSLRRKEEKNRVRLLEANENYCSKLRSLLVDVRLKIDRTHSELLFYELYLPGSFLLNNAHYQTQENDIYREIQKSCR